MEELKATKDMDPLKLGVWKLITFPSGAALVTYNKVEELKTLLSKSETVTIEDQRN